MTCSHAARFSATWLAGWAAAGATANAQGDADLRAATLAEVRRQEEVALTFYIEASCALTRGEGESKTRAGEVHMTVWRTAEPLGAMRLHLAPEIMPVASGGFAADERIVTYNGRIGLTANLAHYREGEPRQERKGFTFHRGRPLDMERSADYGWLASLLGAMERSRSRLSDAIAGAEFSADADGSVSAVARHGDGDSWRWNFVRDGGLALRSCVHSKNGRVLYEARAYSWHSLDHGIRFPESAEIIFRYTNAPATTVAVHCHAASVNDPRVVATQFVYEIDPGCSVTDADTYETFTAGRDDDDLLATIRAQVEHAKRLQQEGRVPRATSPLGPPLLWVGAGLILIVVALWRRKLARSATAVLLLAATVTAQDDGTRRWAAAWEVPGLRADNCALNVALFTRTWFGMDASPTEVASQLGLGKDRGRIASLQEIAVDLVRSGLQVQARSGVGARDLCRRLFETGDVGIVHLSNRDGHFAVAIGLTGESAAIIDAGVEARRVTVDSPSSSAFWSVLSPVVLFVSRSERAKTAAVPDESITVDVGVVSRRDGDIEATAEFTSTARNVVATDPPTGTCGCLRGVSLRAIGGDRFELTVRLDPSSWGRDVNERFLVPVHLDDEPANLVVSVAGSCDDGSRRQAIRSLPDRVLWSGLRAGGTHHTDIRILCPVGVRLDQLSLNRPPGTEANDIAMTIGGFDVLSDAHGLQVAVQVRLTAAPTQRGLLQATVVCRSAVGEHVVPVYGIVR